MSMIILARCAAADQAIDNEERSAEGEAMNKMILLNKTENAGHFIAITSRAAKPV